MKPVDEPKGWNTPVSPSIAEQLGASIAQGILSRVHTLPTHVYGKQFPTHPQHPHCIKACC